MRAWQMGELGDPWTHLREVQRQLETPGPGRLKIDVQATDLNFADILQCQGTYQVRLEPPFTPGMSTAGVVVQAGPGVEIAPGTCVAGPTIGTDGGFAEQATLLAEQATVLPDGVDARMAAAIHVTYGTAWFGLFRRGALQPGETVLVLAAAGGVGSAAVDLAKLRGAWVIAAAGGADKCASCRDLGADEVVDYTAEDLYARVMSLTDGRGVDVVYDPVGGAHFDVARRLLAWEGRLLVIGFASGDIPSAPANHALVKNYSVVGVHMGGYRQRDPEPFAACYREVYRWLLDGRLSPLIDRYVGFDGLPEALRDLAGRRTRGRLVFDPRA